MAVFPGRSVNIYINANVVSYIGIINASYNFLHKPHLLFIYIFFV